MPFAPLFSALIAAAPPKAPIEPMYLYNGVDRPFAVTIHPPRGGKNLKLILREYGKPTPWAEVPVKGGKVMLDQLVPRLWTEKPSKVLWANLITDGKVVEPGLVLQPMTVPPVATLDPATKNPVWTPDEDAGYTGIRCWVDELAVLQTNFGEITVRMRPDAAPNTVFNFIQLAKGGYYRDVIFHRIVQKGRTGEPFVAQGGDPSGTGAGSPGYSIVIEKSALPHDFGVMGMARSTDPNTAGSQFYFALSRGATQHLDNRYTTFAEIVSGHDVLKKLSEVKIGPKDDRPENPPVLSQIRFVFPANSK